MKITIERLQGDEWEVAVLAESSTRHRVRVLPADRKRFGGSASPETLLRETFWFLLEREPNTAILRSFDLGVVNTYFPEYEADIRRRLDEPAASND